MTTLISGMSTFQQIATLGTLATAMTLGYCYWKGLQGTARDSRATVSQQIPSNSGFDSATSSKAQANPESDAQIKTAIPQTTGTDTQSAQTSPTIRMCPPRNPGDVMCYSISCSIGEELWPRYDKAEDLLTQAYESYKSCEKTRTACGSFNSYLIAERPEIVAKLVEGVKEYYRLEIYR